MASSVEALAEAFEGTLRELRRLQRHLKGGFEGFLNGPSNSISQAPPLRYLPEEPLTDCLHQSFQQLLAACLKSSSISEKLLNNSMVTQYLLESSCLPEQLRHIIRFLSSACFLIVTQWMPLRPTADRSFLVLFCCLPRLRWRNASLAGGFAVHLSRDVTCALGSYSGINEWRIG